MCVWWSLHPADLAKAGFSNDSLSFDFVSLLCCSDMREKGMKIIEMYCYK